MSNMTYVRWAKGEDRRGRMFDPLSADHPAASSRCDVCGSPLGNGERVQLVAVAPDPEDQEKFDSGSWCSCSSILLHEDCVSSSDQSLEDYVRELQIL